MLKVMPNTPQQNVTCIIPALNEEKTIAKVVEAVGKVSSINEVLVIDDGSEDNTAAVAKTAGAKVVSHMRNCGKGAAMKTGAEHAKNAYIVYVDADIVNIETKKIEALLKPLTSDKADFVKGSYQYAGGRVTKLVVKPLLKIVFPFLDLEHPLSGEVALNKKKFHFDELEDGWGVDIQLVLQAARRDLRIAEVLMGNKEHKHQDLKALSRMSEQIIRTILSELQLIANKHKVVFFDLDETLINCSSISVIGKEWGFLDEFETLKKRVQKGEIPDKEITKTLARHFKGKTKKDIDEVCSKMPINSHAAAVIDKLRKQRYRVRIVSSAYSPVVEYFARELNVHDIVCPRINTDKQGVWTGVLRASRFEDKDCSCCGQIICKKKAVDYVRKRFKASRDECVAVGDGKSDRCMFEISGLALSYQTDAAKQRIENMSEVLMYVE